MGDKLGVLTQGKLDNPLSILDGFSFSLYSGTLLRSESQSEGLPALMASSRFGALT